ncbi:MAG: tetratricopeptide repeat protein [Deltaproteobacteria bacterium]|nr:tetratricopeptide repeat protein [Deltaproteobacteria bacterium]
MRFAMFRGVFLSLVATLTVLVPNYSWAAPAAATQKETAPKATGNAASTELNEKGVQAVKSNDFAKAETLFRKSLSADSRNLTAVFNLAGVYLNNKRQKEAIALLNQYIKEYSKDAGLYARRGDVYFSLKDLDAAGRDYEHALKLEPEYPGVPSKLGTIYTLTRRTKDAEAMLMKAVAEEPKNGQLLQNLSALFLINGKAQESISTAKRALQVAPNSEVYVTLGNAYETLGDVKNSLISFQRASDLGDTRPELKAKIEELKKVNS